MAARKKPAGPTPVEATTSRAFPAPETGQIAIKVINHYGDEVMQVYDIATV